MPPLVYIAISWIAGLVIAHHWLVPRGVSPASLVLLCLIPISALFLWREDRSMRLASASVLFLFLGALRYQLSLPDLDDPASLAYHNGSGWVTLEGIVRGYPDVRDTWTNLKLEAEAIDIDGQAHPTSGLALVRAPRFPKSRYGDHLLVSGPLETPPVLDGFDYGEYLARRAIYSWLPYAQIQWVESGQGSPFWEALYALKDRASATIARLMPEPEAALLQGILLGVRGGIPPDLYEEFNLTGTSHVLVISGANITIVAVLFQTIFGRILGKRRAYWFTMAGILLYVLLVGADPAVTRAGLMGVLVVTAAYLGRRATAYVSLLATAMVLTLITPQDLWDVGFQLSFAAALSLVLFVPPLERLLERGLGRVLPPHGARQGVRILSDFLIVTLAAQILTLPLVVYHFGRLSLVSPLANLLIQPAQAPIMILGGVATLTGLVSFLGPVAQVLFWGPWLFLAYTVAVVRWLASWPLASLDTGPVGVAWLVLYCGLVLGIVWLARRRRLPSLHLPAWTMSNRVRAILLAGLLVIAVLAGLALQQLPDGRLHVAFLDVGQGDAILITGPHGQQVLVDGGPSPSALVSALGREMPFWDRSLDLLILTHPDADHVTGLAGAVARYEVKGWLDNGSDDPDATLLQCRQVLAAKQVPCQSAHAGDRVDLGQDIVLEVLHPQLEPLQGTGADDNNNSLVVRLTWDRACFLLAGDMETEAEGLLLESGQDLAAGVLKVAHHGSGNATSAEWLAAVDPSYAVISVAADNRFNHPAQQVLDRLAQVDGLTLLRTDQQGTIEFITDGHRLWVQTHHR